jgi:hypothetical protein
VSLTGVLDDHALSRYRALLDAEDAAFDELEHDCEDGRRDHFESDLATWQHALRAKLTFLREIGLFPDEPI